jgi:hypothetical protein
MGAGERTALSGAPAAAAYQARLAEYTRLRCRGYTPVQAALVLRVSERTRQKYERLFAAQQHPAASAA